MDGLILTIGGEKNGTILAITISVNSSNTQRCEVAKNIKAQLEDIGIPVTVKEISDRQYNYYLTNKNYQVLLTGVYNGYSPDVSYFYGEKCSLKMLLINHTDVTMYMS